MYPDYTLVLEKDQDVVFSSREHGIKPLAECVSKYRGRLNGCVLFDIVVGIAAARLIAYSGIISEVNAGVISEPALEHLKKHDIIVCSKKIVGKILNRDKTGICPMETMSSEFDDDEEFFQAVLRFVSL